MWNYAKLSSKAKQMGVPEQMIETFIQHGGDKGIAIEKRRTMPKIATAVGFTLLVTNVVNEIKTYIKEKNAREDNYFEYTKHEFIQNLKQNNGETDNE